MLLLFDQQLGFLWEFLLSLTLKLKYRKISYVFGVSKKKAQKCNKKLLRDERIDVCPPILAQEFLQKIEKEIKKQH